MIFFLVGAFSLLDLLTLPGLIRIAAIAAHGRDFDVDI